MAYIQRIVVKSVIEVPIRQSKTAHTNDSTSRLYLIDALRAPLAHLFDLNEFIRNFHTTGDGGAGVGAERSSTTLVGDLCVHVGELHRGLRTTKQQQQSVPSSNEFNRHILPEFNCLYLSPANFWSNDFTQFTNDDDLLGTLAQAVSDKDAQVDSDSDKDSAGGFFSQALDFIFSAFKGTLNTEISKGLYEQN